LAVSLFFERLTPLMTWFKRHAIGVRIASGILLVILGAFMAFGRLAAISSIAARYGDLLARAIERSPGAMRYASAGIWGLIAAAILFLPILLGRKTLTPLRVSISLVFLLIASGDLIGLWSTARLVAGWLSFQGA